MRNALRLASAYLRHYRKQTAALFVGIMLSAALLTGVGSLFFSGKEAAKENARTEYGDWHYEMRCDFPWFEDFEADVSGSEGGSGGESPADGTKAGAGQGAGADDVLLRGDGFRVESYGVETVRKAISEPFNIQYVYGEAGYMEMMGRELLEGKLPEKTDEIAADRQTLRNLGVPEELGSRVELDGEAFTLSGIVAEMPEKLGELLGDYMQVFVSSELDYGMNGRFLYLRFDESEPVLGQIKAFSEHYGIDGSTVARNNGIAGYVGAEEAKLSAEEIRTAFADPTLGIPWIWGMLNENETLTEGAVLLALAVFSAFIIYSIFQVSVLRRLSQYSVMQTLGMTDGAAFGMLMLEMLLIFAGGYVAGAVLGNGVAALIYRKAGRIFITRSGSQGGVVRHTGVSTEETAAELSVSTLPDAGAFHVDVKIIWLGAVFLILVLALISLVLVRKMRKLTLRQMIAKDTAGGKRNRKIYSIKHENLTGILAKKFMFSRKGTFIGILLSLSVGSVIFLGAAYVTENTRINNELTFAADDGLGSDIQVYEESDSLKDTIPEKTAEELKGISGLESVLPVRYMLGEIPLDDGMLRSGSFFAETAGEEGFEPDPVIMEKYNGQIVQSGEDDYRLKVNIYGYDDEMLESLNDYVLEGSIDPDQMREENTVLFKTLMDGQGNYDVIGIGAGDTVRLRTPEDPEADGEALKFLGREEDYRDTELKIGALISRPLAKVDTYIGDDGLSNVDIIMTNEQMEKNFGVTGYQTISISLPEGTDAEDAAKAADEIRGVVSGVSRCVVKDYTAQIEAQNLYLDQQIMFFYGIALVLLMISLLHIMNSMQYLVAERRYEFSILRAMGITDEGFLKMLMKEGIRYGIYSSIVMLAVYWIVQKVLYYFMVHLYLYLHPQGMISAGYLIFMAVLNIVLCTGAMVVSGRRQPAEAKPQR